MRIFTPREINQPKGKLIVPEVNTTHNFSGTETVEDLIRAAELNPVVVNASGDWTPFADDFDYQRIGENANIWLDKDTDECPVSSQMNAIQTFMKGTGTPLEKESRRFNAKDAGIIPGVGGTLENAQKSFQNTGMVADSVYPSDGPGMTLDTFFQPIPNEIYAHENFLSKGYKPYFIPISQALMPTAFKYGTIIGVVSGTYIFNNIGELIRTTPQDNHCVAPCRVPTTLENWYPTQDSETPGGFVKFSPDYTFDYLYLIIVKKTTMFYKLAGKSAVFVPDPESQTQLVPFETGQVYKTDEQTNTYQNIHTFANYAELKAAGFTFADWMLSKAPWDSAAFINSLT